MSPAVGCDKRMAPRGGTIGKLRFRIRELSREVWVRVTAFAVLGALTAIIGYLVKDFIPSDLPAKIGAEAIESILQILASSMLTVTTFSLSILTAAYAAAGSTATPRAVRLLVSDPVSQTVLATFIGAFLFSLVSIILLKTQIYGQAGRLVLFGATLLVVLVVVVSLLRWIDHLGQLGRVGDTVGRVARAASDALEARLEAPWLGANPLRGAPPSGTVPVCPETVGYLQHCDMAGLSKVAEDNDVLIYLTTTPGDFVSPATVVLNVSAVPHDPDEEAALRKRLLACLTIGEERNFDQDPRFGIQVLSETGQRALSPGINDPGSAVLAVGHMVGVLCKWREQVAPAVEYPRIYMASITAIELLKEGFLPLARDGAANFQVQRALLEAMKSLGGISPSIYGDGVVELSREIMHFNRDSVALKSQRADLVSIFEEILTISQPLE